MPSVWHTLGGYLWWTYPRGSLHYDVMVTLILAFIFLIPGRIFHDKPLERVPHQTGVVVYPDGTSGFVCQVEASAVTGSSDDERRESLRRIIEPITGEISLTRYEPVRDKGQTVAYRAWVERP
jgi:hypothetical protein